MLLAVKPLAQELGAGVQLMPPMSQPTRPFGRNSGPQSINPVADLLREQSQKARFTVMGWTVEVPDQAIDSNLSISRSMRKLAANVDASARTDARLSSGGGG